LVTGLLVARRVGSGIGAVLGNIRATEQIDKVSHIIPRFCDQQPVEICYSGRGKSEISIDSREVMERETGIGPATNSLEGCDSTTELLPLAYGINRLEAPQNFFRLQTLPLFYRIIRGQILADLRPACGFPMTP
jgi:hypothetical protein